MDIRKVIYFIIIFLISTTTVSAQFKIDGVIANIGINTVVIHSPFNNYKLNDYNHSFVATFGIFVEENFWDKSSIGIELLWVQTEDFEKKEYTNLNFPDGTSYESYSFNNKYHISHLSLPIYYRIKLDNLGIKFGIQSKLFLFTRHYYKTKRVKQDGTTSKNEGAKWDKYYSTFDFGPKLGIDYKLNKRLRIRSDLYYGIPILNSDSYYNKIRILELTCGINYFFDNVNEENNPL